MMNNPFSQLLNVIKEEGGQGSSSFYLGKVTKLYEVTFNGITLYSDDLYMNPDIKLNIDDEVLLLDMGEKFVIICKVVEI
ncbi:MAG: hypothetical protein E6585_23960 [Serratia marcescens]|nr:hypothetical protein [Serratia marcescens]